MKHLKDRIAIEKGYPSWDEMYNWISREGQRPEIVAQLIEAAVQDYVKAHCELLLNQSFEGWTSDARNGYMTALFTIKSSFE
jgi:hypothetical protein